jgi:hypothetical protein
MRSFAISFLCFGFVSNFEFRISDLCSGITFPNGEVSMDRHNPYEAAFEAYLNEHDLCYIGVDEKKRSLLDDMPVKNLDFVVLGGSGARLLVDVKGRRFPGGPPEKQRRVWEKWSTQEDIRGLSSWMRLFGPGYLGLFVFMYRIGPGEILADETDLWTWHETRYRLLAVSVDEYARHMRVRSPRWGTVSLQGSVFHSLARPFRHFSQDLKPVASCQWPLTSRQ